MATEEQKEELKRALTKLVDSKFGGDWSKAFEEYSKRGGAGGVIEKDELKEILSDAGFVFTGAWAKGIIKAADMDADKGVSWEEFQALLAKE